ncbi:threonine ammonia-lyase [Pelagibacterium sp.]|uniref:threonine ammonia-lyase n=1 Tax=Pelagibacterium sp. TaxID=1967288 RepID=UPI003A949557
MMQTTMGHIAEIDLEGAVGRLNGNVVRTPLLESEVLNARTGGRILFKSEMFQRTGSFKFRGAFNCLSTLSPEDRTKGVVAFSSGNHGRGVSLAARLLGIDAVIAMPDDSPHSKVRGIEADGGKVITYSRRLMNRDAAIQPYLDAGRIMIHPYENPHVIAGQATATLESLEQAEALGAIPDMVIAPCGGGGLTSGAVLALAHRAVKAQVWGAEPEGYDDMLRSLQAGKRVGNEATDFSICDAIMTPSPGVLAFSVLANAMSGVGVVSDDQTAHAMRIAAQELKVVVEPGGAVALATLLSDQVDIAGRTVICILSGGNADLQTYTGILGRTGR